MILRQFFPGFVWNQSSNCVAQVQTCCIPQGQKEGMDRYEWSDLPYRVLRFGELNSFWDTKTFNRTKQMIFDHIHKYSTYPDLRGRIPWETTVIANFLMSHTVFENIHSPTRILSPLQQKLHQKKSRKLSLWQTVVGWKHSPMLGGGRLELRRRFLHVTERMCRDNLDWRKDSTLTWTEVSAALRMLVSVVQCLDTGAKSRTIFISICLKQCTVVLFYVFNLHWIWAVNFALFVDLERFCVIRFV